MRNLHFGQLLFMVALVFVLASCGATSHDASFETSFTPDENAMVRVASVEDVAPREDRGDHADFDLAAELRTQLERQLDEHGLLATGLTPMDQQYALEAKLVDYEPGNAFKRWLLPGAGSTVLSVECVLYDGETEIGRVESIRSVALGGGFTIGAWKSIFESVAGDIVEEITPKLRVEA